MYTGPEQHGDHIETFTNTLIVPIEMENFYKKNVQDQENKYYVHFKV